MKILILFLTLSQSNFNSVSVFISNDRIGIRLDDSRIGDLPEWFEDGHIILPSNWENGDWKVKSSLYIHYWRLTGLKTRLEISKKLKNGNKAPASGNK